MAANQAIFIILGVFAALLFALIIALFFVSRRSQKVMNSLLDLLMSPERAKIQGASRVVAEVMGREVERIEVGFGKISAVLEQHIMRAEALEKQLGMRNKELVAIADSAVKGTGKITDELEKQLSGFKKVIESKEWAKVENSAEDFQSHINELLNQIDNTVQESGQHAKTLQVAIDGWIESGKTLSGQMQADMELNTSQMNSMVLETDAMQQKLSDLSKSVAEGFAEVKREAVDYENLMTENDKLLGKQLDKMDAFSKQSKKLLTYQLNNLTSTANAVGSQIRLAEASIEKQEKGLTAAITNLMESSQTTEGYIKTIASEVSGLAGKFQIEIRDFATGIVGELNTVQGVATTTLSDTKQAAGAFSDSVRAMTEGVRETLMEMNAAHAQLTGQSAELVKMSTETAEQLKPLSELIEKYYSSLPELTRGSAEMTSQLSGEIESLDKRIRELGDAVQKSIAGMADSSLKLEHLSGQSRQQMIDLLSDYAKATDTMQTLNRQMAEARATAPMAAVAKVPEQRTQSANKAAAMNSGDFIKYSESIMEKLHELSVDLTRAVGAEIPAAVWNKYHAGDKTIFSKWFAKMLGAADKRRLRELFKNDAVFRSQATQFVRGFAKMMAGAEQTDNKDMVSATLLKTDLGQMYLALKANL
ncbi:MAG: hypothetical protein FWE50_04565 [Alphaproteobacteria bacterium]|nr:hypothetical protein [Alphaproteobacteria bacterium]